MAGNMGFMGFMGFLLFLGTRGLTNFVRGGINPSHVLMCKESQNIFLHFDSGIFFFIFFSIFFFMLCCIVSYQCATIYKLGITYK